MTYQLMFYGSIIGILITLPLAIYLFVKLQIRDVIQDLTGINLKGSYQRTPRRVHSNTDGKLKEVSREIRLRKEHERLTQDQTIEETELLTDKLEPTTLLQSNELEDTSLLTANETTLLGEPPTHSNWFNIEKNIVVVHVRPIMMQESEIIDKVYEAK